MIAFTLDGTVFVRIGNLDVPVDTIIYIQRGLSDGGMQTFRVALRTPETYDELTVIDGVATVADFAVDADSVDGP